MAGKCEQIDALHIVASPVALRVLAGKRFLTRVKSFTPSRPNLQVPVKGSQMWRGMRRRRDKDSHDSDQIPTLQCKICPPLSEFTTRARFLVIGLNVRRNQPQSSIFRLNVRSRNEPSSLYCSGSGRCEASDGNLSCIFSTEKYPVIRKRGRQVKVVSNIHPNFLGLNVRRNGPQPSICVRTLSPITTCV